MAGRGLLSADAAVEVLTVRKSRPHEVRVAAVLDRLVDQSERLVVAERVAAYWSPLPARAKCRKVRRPVPVEAWGPGVQLTLPVGVEVEF